MNLYILSTALILSSDRLHTFAVFSEDQNLSKTAKRLHLSQPAVHAQLKLLADDLGVPLYRREGRGLVLTREGVEVAAFARDLEERSRDLLAQLSGQAPHSPIVLAAGAGALVHLLAPGLRAFRRSHREVRVEVVSADATHALSLVRAGSAHVGVGVVETPPTDLRSEVIATARQVAVLPKSHPLAARRSLELADLVDEDFVMPPEGGPQRAALDAAFQSVGFTPRVSAVVRGWDVVLKLVALDVGVGIVNATCTIPKNLITKPLRELPPVTYRAFTRSRPRDAAAVLVRAFVDAK